MNRAPNPMKKLVPAVVVILAVGIVVTVYGLTRSNVVDERSPAVAEQLAIANKYLQQGKPEQALKAVEELRGPEAKKRLGEEAQLLRLRALEGAGMHKELGEAAIAFNAEFPKSTSATEVELMQLTSEIATAGLSKPGLLKNVETFIAAHPDHEGSGKLSLALAKQQVALGDKEAARRRLGEIVANPKIGEDISLQARQELGNLNLEALMKGEGANVTVHKVKSGESMWSIANRYKVTQELLMRANPEAKPNRLQKNQEIRVPQVDFSLECDVARNELTLKNKGEFVKVYRVRTGRVAGATPEGEFKILNKKQAPTWKPGDGRVYLPGDPNNELGTRWMSFEGDILGIHGTIHPETVGNYASNGCIGMTTADVEELFDLVNVGTSLKITGTQDLKRGAVIAAPAVPAPLKKEEIAKLGN